jgi:adenine-specific DNA-methyltransferase
MATRAQLSAKQIKETGAHYTPPELAEFLAANVAFALKKKDTYRVLDPACGDGQLLYSLALALSPQQRRATVFVGMENDSHALEDTRVRIAGLPDAPQLELIHSDFLAWTHSFRKPQMFEQQNGSPHFDAIIANPPYVRTQVLGADSARKLAAAYGLTGRVDLYHAFALAMTDVLAEGGVLGLLCSNRFLSVQSGASLRKDLLESYDLHEVFDLGDTKLFEAAVLPAIVIGTKRTGVKKLQCGFTKIYELHDTSDAKAAEFSNPLAAITARAEGVIKTNERTYVLERGTLSPPADHSEPWRISSPASDLWLASIHSRASKTFADFVEVRVGVKTTADNVFIRDDWETFPDAERPEEELLRPLLSNSVAAQWVPSQSERQPFILYTHTIKNGKRSVINLEAFPRAKRYLEKYREQLTNRRYVIEAGRKWYEIWVPQNPADWKKPKVVFSDISNTPRFFLDRSGSVVDGNCYWFTSDNEDHLYLLLAIANSTFVLRYYDLVCGNKLYAGRRRFITQYVERFPVPNPDSEIARRIICTAKRLCGGEPLTDVEACVATLSRDVWQSFGLSEEIPG